MASTFAYGAIRNMLTRRRLDSIVQAEHTNSFFRMISEPIMLMQLWRSHLLLAAFLLFTPACTIVTYDPSEPMKLPSVDVHDRKEFLSFFYLSEPPTEGSSQTLSWQSQLIKESLENHSRFIKVIVSPSIPANGVHVNVYQTGDRGASAWCKVSIWTLGVVPCYFESTQNETHFDVFVNNILKGSYRYNISETGISWIGLLPFSWINLFTTTYNEAFAGNIALFIADARRDGFL